jgi:hypothetical protein
MPAAIRGTSGSVLRWPAGVPVEQSSNDLHRCRDTERDRIVLSQVSAAHRQDERVAGRPAHEPERHRLLRLGRPVLLEDRPDAADRGRLVLRRSLLRAEPDGLQGVHRRIREQCLSPRRKGAPESKASPRCAPADFIFDALDRPLLSDCPGLHSPSRTDRAARLLPDRLDDCSVVPACLRSAAAVCRQGPGVAPRAAYATRFRFCRWSSGT